VPRHFWPENIGKGLSGRFIMPTMANDAPIPVDDQSMLFRQIVDLSPALIHTARPDGYLDFFNQRWLNFIGQPLERLLGWQWTSFIHPEDVEAFVQKWRESIATGEGFEGTARVRRADGEYRWMLHHKLAIRSDSGKTIKWHGSSVDIDGQKRAEEQLLESAQELHRSEGYLAEAQRLSHTGSFGWKPGCEEHVWSDETYRIFEYSPRDKVTLDMIVERVHPEDRNFVLETVERASIRGGAIDYEYRLLFPDDRVKNVHVLARRLETNSDDLEFAGAVIDITEAKRAEEKIRLSEKELQILVEAIPAYVGTNLPDGSLDFISQSWLDYTGLSREQWIGWGWVSTMHPDDVDRVVANWRAALAAGTPVEYQLRCRGAEGIYHWFLYRGVPFCDDGGKVIKWYGTVTNIDVLKETESALQTREQQLLGIIETIPSLLWSASPTLVPTHLSKRLLEYFGAPYEEFANGGWESFIHPDDLEETAKALLRAMDAGESFSVVHRLRRADGEYRWHHARGEPLRDPEGKIIQWYGLSVDIDDRKRAEETLRKSERELRTLIDVLPAYVGTCLPDGTADFLSQSWLEYSGQTREEEAMGWGWARALHPDDADRVSANWRAGLASGEPVEMEFRCRRADGTYRWFLNRNLPLRNDEGKIIKWYGILFDIDALKKTESALQTREQQLVGIIETIPSMLWALWPNGEPSHLSKRFLEYFGAPFEEFANRGWVRIIHPDDQEETGKLFARALETGELFNVINRWRRADGEYRWHHTMGEPLRDLDGKIIQWYGISVDVDDRKRAEETLRKNERELRTLIDVMPAYVGTALPDGTADFFSQRWLDYFGQTREEAMGWGWAYVIHPDDVDRVLANWQSGLVSGEPVEQELRCRRADGVYRWFLNRNLALRDDEGKIVKWYGILFDIDVLKKTESALQMREHELVGIIETIPSMLWSASPTGETTHLSQRFIEYFGASFEEIVNRGWETFIHPDDREETVKAFARAISSGQSYRAIHRLRRRDGEYLWHHSMGEPLRDPYEKIIQYYGLTVDIDDRKRAEDHLRDTGIKLAKASRLATVAELAASIAHELNQPLMSILANAQAAKRWLNAAQSNMTEVNSSIDRTIRDARAADETMRHIRALFKQESFVKKDVKIPDILQEVVRIVQEDPKKRAVPVECHFEESLPAILVDQIQIQQVFINLIVNAIEALEGQQVAPLVTLRAVVTDSDRMLVQVIDNGPGVHDPERIFDAFMTTKEKGMGIGLAVSRSIVEAHGGWLWAENNKADGATFNVALPLSHASPTTAQIQEYA
jgi:PAS domain S-box-containing protein